MTTYNVFNEQVAAATDVADGDLFLVWDTSAGVNKSVTYAIMRSEMNGVVATTATTLSVTAASHAGKTIVINSAAAIAVTLPEATGTGNVYTFKVGVAFTGTSSTIAALTTDVIEGYALVHTTDTLVQVSSWATSATSDKVSGNGTTTGGVPGDTWVLIDAEDGVWQVNGVIAQTGSIATPFSQT